MSVRGVHECPHIFMHTMQRGEGCCRAEFPNRHLEAYANSLTMYVLECVWSSNVDHIDMKLIAMLSDLLLGKFTCCFHGGPTMWVVWV